MVGVMTGALDRFVEAQEATYDGALAELVAGRKVGHWIWWIFPQLRGLGVSTNSTFFGLSGLDEARAYAAHPILGPRLHTCVEAVLAQAGRGVERVLGGDAVKLRSCLTLFARAMPTDELFARALVTLFDEEDPVTVSLLARTKDDAAKEPRRE
jgi:uncharacterized protein (DUF1810 family)